MKNGFIIPLAALVAVAAGVVCACIFSGCSKNAEKTAELSFHSFDGGGPEYKVEIADPGVLTYTSETRYNKPDHAQMTGAGYDVIFTFKGVKQGETGVTITSQSPVSPSTVTKYKAVVADDLSVTLEKLSEEEQTEYSAVKPVPQLVLCIDDKVFYPNLEDNPATAELIEKLSTAELSLTVSGSGDYLSAELPWTLPGTAAEGEVHERDIVLTDDNRLAFCRGDAELVFTRLGSVGDNFSEEYKDALSGDSAEIKMWVEWSE